MAVSELDKINECRCGIKKMELANSIERIRGELCVNVTHPLSQGHQLYVNFISQDRLPLPSVSLEGAFLPRLPQTMHEGCVSGQREFLKRFMT
jgi:hypothetical protein